ncbi:uncharacterized protein LOC111886191 [Lactuca sativa]|uniref:SWIM-type domain-containing protein n=1 Tax=Lactuca sativa TaxID=4236 RepID=A0A9R1VVR5_LACSA|nr:uncharacterized protein LOC111886191 [Lactuca sativa]KAJ0213440.1 hypothetical protein LSAT_V11C400181730 [Lactuca sativa]
MASSSGTKKVKGPDKVYVRDEDSDDDLIDFSFLDFAPETFKPTSNLSDDPFLNMLCDENMLRRTLDGMGDDDQEVGVKDPEHDHIDDQNDGEVGVEYRVHDPNIHWKQMKPVVGECYESPAQLRFALTNYAVANGYQLWFMKSDRHRVIVRCGKIYKKDPCPFRVYAAWQYNERTFQIKSICDIHLCARNFNFGTLVSCNWLAKQYLKDIIMKPQMTLTEMKEDVLRMFSVNVSKGQCHRARTKAREMIEGKLEEHYANLWDYAAEILRSNPGSTCKVRVDSNASGMNYFKRFYVFLKAFKDGWNRGCKRVIGLDGCYLKGQIKGELLTAIGRDADNHVYPIAWAVIDVEKKDHWTWFIELLVADLDLDYGRGLVVISDQHKGLLQAVTKLLPYVEHRQCARNIYANFRKKYTRLELKNLFWEAANSTVAFFSHGYACEAIENGISECFNSMIIHMRKKPILTMLEEIRIYLMNRFYHQAATVSQWKGDYGPNTLEKIKEFGKHMRFWIVIPSGGALFETRHGYSAYKVDLDAHSCSCRLWEISGLPCVHAQAAINFTHRDPTDFISFWFHKDKFIETYRDNILPVNGSNM